METVEIEQRAGAPSGAKKSPLEGEAEEALMKLLARNKVPAQLGGGMLAGLRASLEKEEASSFGTDKRLARHLGRKYRFFEDLARAEGRGTCLGYDEVVEYLLPGEMHREEEKKFIDAAMGKVFGRRAASWLVAFDGKKASLLIKYKSFEDLYDPIEVGPRINTSNAERARDAGSAEAGDPEEFKKIWGRRVEHRKFGDSSIRVCASFEDVPRHAIPYVCLGRIFTLATGTGDIACDVDWRGIWGANAGAALERRASVKMPVFCLESVEKKYAQYNRAGADEAVRKRFMDASEQLPVKILDYRFAGPRNRRTRVGNEGADYLYAKVNRGYKWPVEEPRLMEYAVKSLLGILGKSMEKAGMVARGICGKEKLLVQERDEQTSIVLEIEEEMGSNPRKYAETEFRKAFDRFMRGVAEEEPFFRMGCFVVKRFLKSHGIFPHYLGDEATEILCYKTSLHCRTPGSFFHSFIATSFQSGYTLDIRQGKGGGKIQACARLGAPENRGVRVVHDAGVKHLPLPEDLVIRRMNAQLRKAVGVAGLSACINSNYSIDRSFSQLHHPALRDYDYVLSSRKEENFVRVHHYPCDEGGHFEHPNVESREREGAWVSRIRDMGSYVYYGGAGEYLMVKVKKGVPPRLIEGAAVMLSGLKYLWRVRPQ